MTWDDGKDAEAEFCVAWALAENWQEKENAVAITTKEYWAAVEKLDVGDRGLLKIFTKLAELLELE